MPKWKSISSTNLQLEFLVILFWKMEFSWNQRRLKPLQSGDNHHQLLMFKSSWIFQTLNESSRKINKLGMICKRSFQEVERLFYVNSCICACKFNKTIFLKWIYLNSFVGIYIFQTRWDCKFHPIASIFINYQLKKFNHHIHYK